MTQGCSWQVTKEGSNREDTPFTPASCFGATYGDKIILTYKTAFHILHLRKGGFLSVSV
jgi:hypothetical protein